MRLSERELYEDAAFEAITFDMLLRMLSHTPSILVSFSPLLLFLFADHYFLNFFFSADPTITIVLLQSSMDSADTNVSPSRRLLSESGFL